MNGAKCSFGSVQNTFFFIRLNDGERLEPLPLESTLNSGAMRVPCVSAARPSGFHRPPDAGILSMAFHGTHSVQLKDVKREREARSRLVESPLASPDLEKKTKILGEHVQVLKSYS